MPQRVTSPSDDPAPAAAPPPAARSLTQQTTQGFVWLFAQNIAEKVLVLAGMILVTRLLAREEFAHVTLVYTVTTFATLLQQAGLSQLLIQRHGRLRLWENAVFWMSLVVGLGAALLTAASAPVAAGFYSDPALVPLLLVAALSMPLNGIGTVPDAALRGQMRFKFLAALGLFITTLTLALQVGFALAGLGAMSMILAPVIAAGVRSAALYTRYRPRLRRSMQTRRWKYLFADSARLLGTQLALMATYQGGQAVLGRTYPRSPIAGDYLFAWNLSDQPLRLLVNNLAGVLFPALSRIQDDASRQTAAFLRATRLLLIVGVPTCLVQSVLAGPIIRLVFDPKWTVAIPVMAALSVGMSARLVFGPCESMFLAQRRTKLYLTIALVYAAAFFAAVVPAARYAGEDRAAAAVALAAGAVLLALGPVCLRLAIKPAGGTWRDVLRVYAAPVVAGAIAYAPVPLLMPLFPASIAGDLIAVGVVSLATSLVYGVLIYLLARQEFVEILGRVTGLVRTLRSRRRFNAS